jgi:hypothetical protein
MGCNALTSITIPNSVTSILYGAFENCSSLNSVTIPNSITHIWADVFSGCTSLTSVTIPNSVTYIDANTLKGSSAFWGCSGLTSIVVEEGNPIYDSRDNCNAIIRTEDNCLVVGCQTTVFPDSIESIGPYAFVGCKDLISLTIPSSVTSIGYGAFYGCNVLTSITFEGTTPPQFQSAFYDVFPCIVDTIYVPEGCVQNYSSIINDNTIMITDGHVGVDNHVASNPLIVYPNPTSNIVNVECEIGNGVSGDVTIQLYDIYGKLVGVPVVGANDHSPLQRATAQIDLSRYANGVYFIKAVANGHVMGIRKVVKQ